MLRDLAGLLRKRLFEDFPASGKAFQRVIRERMAKEADPLLAEKEALAKDFAKASVREISLADARNLIVANEWLGNLGSTEHAWGLSLVTTSQVASALAPRLERKSGHPSVVRNTQTKSSL